MISENNQPDGKTTKADTYKSFSHERPDPKTNPPNLKPIQPQPKPENTKPNKE
ncbi:MAG: hypothetical protein H0S79_11960 [Anaerolineaceae bacterium]|nr:hypothetical protein [Anaerolineaceae bacterium]